MFDAIPTEMTAQTLPQTQVYTKDVWFHVFTADVNAEVARLNTLVRRHGLSVRIVKTEELKKPRNWFHQDQKMLYGVRYFIEAPAVAGEKTKLVGTFEAAEDGESVYRNVAPGFTMDDLEPFAGRWRDCDHCGYKRARDASFVCEREDGARILVGRNCSKAYLGLSFAELVARMGAALELRGDDEEEGWCFGGRETLDTYGLLNACWQATKHFGGYSSDMKLQLQDTVNLLLGRVRNMKPSEKRLVDEIKAADYGRLDFEGFVRYLEGGKKHDGFIEKLKIAVNCPYVEVKRLGLVLAGVGSFVGRTLRRAADERQFGPAKHLDAAIGARIDFEAFVERTRPYESDFGVTLIISMRTRDGASLVHFCSGENTPDAGKWYKVRATVKKHDTNRVTGSPETSLSRAKYVEIEGA